MQIIRLFFLHFPISLSLPPFPSTISLSLSVLARVICRHLQILFSNFNLWLGVSSLCRVHLLFDLTNQVPILDSVNHRPTNNYSLSTNSFGEEEHLDEDLLDQKNGVEQVIGEAKNGDL